MIGTEIRQLQPAFLVDHAVQIDHMFDLMKLGPGPGGAGLGLCWVDYCPKQNRFVSQMHSDSVQDVIGLSFMESNFLSDKGFNPKLFTSCLAEIGQQWDDNSFWSK